MSKKSAHIHVYLYLTIPHFIAETYKQIKCLRENKFRAVFLNFSLCARVRCFQFYVRLVLKYSAFLKLCFFFFWYSPSPGNRGVNTSGQWNASKLYGKGCNCVWDSGRYHTMYQICVWHNAGGRFVCVCVCGQWGMACACHGELVRVRVWEEKTAWNCLLLEIRLTPCPLVG